MSQTIPPPYEDTAKPEALSERALYDRYRAVMQRVGEFDGTPLALNLLGIRGYLNGRAVKNEPNAYNDTIAAVWIDRRGNPRVREYQGSVDPGHCYTDTRIERQGCAHLVDGQYLYQRGRHNDQPALVQAGPVTVWRDRDLDHDQNPGETRETGNFGIDIHSGGTGTEVGRWTAGCQVVRGGEGGPNWQELLELIESHPHHKFRYTLVDRAVLGFSLAEVFGDSEAQNPTQKASNHNRPTLRVGDSGFEVRELQHALAEQGHSSGRVDGNFGRKTERAVFAFQRQQRLHVDGIVGQETWSALRGSDSSVTNASVGTQRALLVAIDDYGDPKNNLPSCVADARAFERHLHRVGFDPANVRVVTDASATVESLETGLEWLLEDLDENDRAVFYYSGHGHQIPMDGVVTEVLVLRDGFYIDDRLAERTQELPDGVLTVVLDSCFSGGMDKELFSNVDGSAEFAASKRWRPGSATHAVLDKPLLGQVKGFDASTQYKVGEATMAASQAMDALTGYQRFGAAKGQNLEDNQEDGQAMLKALMLSACSENETASASTSRTRGLSAFTFALLQAIDEHGNNAPAGRLMQSARKTLANQGFKQTPTLHEPPGAFRLAELSFLKLRRDSTKRNTHLEEPGRSALSRFVNSLRSLTKDNPMTDYDEDYMEDGDVAQKVLPLFASLLRQSLAAASNSNGPRRCGNSTKDFDSGDMMDNRVGALNNGDGYDDGYDNDGFESYAAPGSGYDDGEEEGTEKFFGAVAGFLAPKIMEYVMPRVIRGISNVASRHLRRPPPRGPRRGDHRQPRVRRKGFQSMDSSNMSDERAMRMLVSMLQESRRD